MRNEISQNKDSIGLKTSKIVFFIFSVCFIIMPFVWLIISSFIAFKGYLPQSIEYTNIDFSITSYISALEKFNVSVYFGKTLLVALIVSAVTVLVSSMVAFVLNRSNKIVRKIGLLFFIIGIVIPFHMFATDVNGIFSQLNINNSLLSNTIVISVTCIPISIYVYNWYFSKIPKQLIEASILDGFSQWISYYKIEFLYSKPATAVIVLLCFINTSNDLLINEILIKSGSYESLSNILLKMINSENVQYTEIFAITSMIFILSVFLPYIFNKLMLQKSIEN